MGTSVMTLDSGRTIPIKEDEDQQCQECHKKHDKLYYAGNQWRCFFCYAWYGWYSNGVDKTGPLEVKEKEVRPDGSIVNRTEKKAEQLLANDKISKEQYDEFVKLYATDTKKARKLLRKSVKQYSKVQREEPKQEEVKVEVA